VKLIPIREQSELIVSLVSKLCNFIEILGLFGFQLVCS
jgi:hypothetical protein